MPTCGDGLGARLIEAAGFELQFLAGFALSATYGLPDVEYLGCSEVAARIQTLTAITSLPLIADGDTGYGNAMTGRRTAQTFARAGAAGIMIEDQRSPKRCGHTEGRSVVARDEALLRVQAVIDARREGLDIVLVARCDARVISFDECLERCVAFATMGAEIIFAEAIPTVDELRMFAEEMRRRAPSAILMVNVLEGGKTPMLPADEYARMGYTIVAYPLSMLMATISACKSMLVAARHDQATLAADLVR